MVEVTPSVKSSTSGFSIESIISKDSSSISSSPASGIHCPTFGRPSPDLLAGSAGEPFSIPASQHSASVAAAAAATMDVLSGVRNGFGLTSPQQFSAHHAVHHPHQHLLTTADSSSLFTSKPMYSPLSAAGAGCGLPALDGGHSALFGQGLSPFHGVAPEHGLSALHALSQKGLGSAASLGLSPASHNASHLGMGMARHQFPLYTWLSRPGAYFHRYTGSEPSFLLPFRKPKRIRTAFSPSQLLRLEHAFEKNHYVVGQERKDLAINLSLTETQVKVWFQNRRTKHKRVKSEEEQETKRKDTKNESKEGSQ